MRVPAYNVYIFHNFQVTKTALQKNLNFEQVCKNPKSTISDRAVARIATHPQFSKKVEAIKAAVEAFKEERTNDGKQGGKKGKVQNQADKVTLQLADTGEEGEDIKNEKEEGNLSAEGKEMIDNVEGEGLLKDTGKATVADLSDKDRSKPTPADIADFQNKEIPEAESVRPASTKSSEVEDSLKNKPQSKAAEKKPKIKPAPKVNRQKEDDGGASDLESSDDEEKEYFDDSTEERFHQQSSHSEDSDDEDDFFVGKVSTFKKKKKKSVDREKKVEKKNEVKSDSTDLLKASDQGQSELDELESRLKSKTNKLQSVFFSSLSGSKAGGGGGAGAGRGRGGNQSRGQGNQKDGRNFGRTSKLQEQHKGQDRNVGADHGKLHSEGRHPESQEKGSAFAGRGRGRGRDVSRQRDSKRGGVFPHQVQQPALHPSWEASRKRKEQQGHILPFQGKKIKFDDDDWN